MKVRAPFVGETIRFGRSVTRAFYAFRMYPTYNSQLKTVYCWGYYLEHDTTEWLPRRQRTA